MKLAHLILAHDNPAQLTRLANRLSDSDADVYIYLDKKTDIGAFANIKEIPNTHFIQNRIDVVWGQYSLVKATLIGFEEILATGTPYSHINLLSGNDYPIQSNADIHRFLFANTGKTFMWYELVYNTWHHGQARMNNRYYGAYPFRGRYRLATVLNKILPARKLPDNLIAYGRSQWLTITPECAAYVIKYTKEHPAVERFFKRTWAVDEVFFQTILCNSPMRETLVNDNLRYIRLKPDFRPATYTMEDADTLTSSGKLYARKFDINVDAAIFDYLDRRSVN